MKAKTTENHKPNKPGPVHIIKSDVIYLPACKRKMHEISTVYNSFIIVHHEVSKLASQLQINFKVCTQTWESPCQRIKSQMMTNLMPNGMLKTASKDYLCLELKIIEGDFNSMDRQNYE